MEVKMSIIQYSIQDAAKIWTKLSNYESNTYLTWQKECMTNREFYEGEQYTEEEKEKLAERGQYDIVVNKIRKAIKGMTGLVSSSIPKYKLVPVGMTDDRKAMLGNKLLDWCWDNSGGLYTYSSAVKSALIDNMAYLHVICPANKKVKFVKLSFDDVIVDPQSKHPLFDDAEMIVIRRYVPIDYVKKVYGLQNLVSEVPSNLYAVSPNLASSNFLSKVFDVSRSYVNLYECYKKENGRIVKETVIGYMNAFREELPEYITEYPVIPLYVEGYDNPYKRGEVHFLKTIQKFINKTYGVTILNAQLMSNPKVFVRDRDIPRGNLDEFSANYSTPGSVNILTGDAQPPYVINGQPLNNAFFSLYMDAKQEFEWLTVPNQILGYGKMNTGQSSDLLDIKEGALESLKEFISVIELACSRLGLVLLQYVQAYVDKETVINITDNLGKIESITVNKKQGLDVENEQSVNQWIQMQKQKQVPDEEIETALAMAIEDSEYVKELFYIMDETNFTNFDVRVIPGSYSPTYQMAMLRLMMELTNTGAVDASVLLEYAPVEDREKLIERFDTIKQLRGYIQNLEDEVKIMKQNYISAQQAVAEQRVTNATEQAKVKLDKLKTEAKIKAMRDKFANQLMTKEKMMDLEKEINAMVLATKQDLFEMRLKADKELSEQTSVPSITEMVIESVL